MSAGRGIIAQNFENVGADAKKIIFRGFDLVQVGTGRAHETASRVGGLCGKVKNPMMPVKKIQ